MKSIMLFLICLASIGLQSQNKMIRGNAKIQTDQKVLNEFDAIVIDMDCDVYVQMGAMPMAEITADRNLLNKLSIEVIDKELTIRAKDGYWIQKGRPIIYLQTSYLNKLTTLGAQTNIGEVHIEGINVDEFETDILYGDITLSGQVTKLKLRSSNQSYYDHRSTVDATALTANEVDAEIKGSNTAVVSVDEKLMVHLRHDASLQYTGNPDDIKLKGSAKKVGEGKIAVSVGGDSILVKKEEAKESNRLQYVELKVKNNSVTRKHFIIKGPSSNGKSFSYGFPMMPFATRVKKVPVGTKIFLQKSGILNKRLITITASDEGKVIDLFSK